MSNSDRIKVGHQCNVLLAWAYDITLMLEAFLTTLEAPDEMLRRLRQWKTTLPQKLNLSNERYTTEEIETAKKQLTENLAQKVDSVGTETEYDERKEAQRIASASDGSTLSQ